MVVYDMYMYNHNICFCKNHPTHLVCGMCYTSKQTNCDDIYKLSVSMVLRTMAYQSLISQHLCNRIHVGEFVNETFQFGHQLVFFCEYV